jgi:hypothetical protein
MERILVSSEAKLEVLVRLREAQPSPVAHWRVPGDEIAVELIAEEMPAADAAEFLGLFQANSAMRGWKTTLWRFP